MKYIISALIMFVGICSFGGEYVSDVYDVGNITEYSFTYGRDYYDECGLFGKTSRSIVISTYSVGNNTKEKPILTTTRSGDICVEGRYLLTNALLANTIDNKLDSFYVEEDKLEYVLKVKSELSSIEHYITNSIEYLSE